jgi:hypothetical protein
MQLTERKTIDQHVGVGHRHEIGGRRRQRDVIAELPRLGSQRHRHRAGAENHQ